MKFRISGEPLDCWTMCGEDAIDPVSELPWPLSDISKEKRFRKNDCIADWYSTASFTTEQKNKIREAFKWLHTQLKYTGNFDVFADRTTFKAIRLNETVKLKSGSVNADYLIERGTLQVHTVANGTIYHEREIICTCRLDINIERVDLQMTFALMFPEFEVINEDSYV